MPPDQYAKALLSGPFDGTAVGWRDSERERALLFSDPYLENRLVLVGRRGTRCLGHVAGRAEGQDRRARRRLCLRRRRSKPPGPRGCARRANRTASRLLLNSEVDYFLMDELVVQYLVASYPEEARTRLAIGTIPLHTRPVHLSLHRSLPDAGAIIKGFNTQLRAMIADRTYHRLLHVDWIRADVDGDGRVEYVAESDQAGSTQPKRAYDLFSQTATTPAPSGPPEQERYFFGGSVYNGWSSVPDKYKVDHLDRPDHTHPTARVLTFSMTRSPPLRARPSARSILNGAGLPGRSQSTDEISGEPGAPQASRASASGRRAGVGLSMRVITDLVPPSSSPCYAK